MNDNPQFAAWYLARIGITIDEARRQGVTDLVLLRSAFEHGKKSHHPKNRRPASSVTARR